MRGASDPKPCRYTARMSSAASSLSLRNDGDVTIVEVLETVLCDVALLDDIGARLQTLIRDEGVTKMVIDMSRVKLMSSSGLGIVLELHNSLKPNPLHLCSVNDDILKMFRVCRLDSMLELDDDVSGAIGRLRG